MPFGFGKKDVDTVEPLEAQRFRTRWPRDLELRGNSSWTTRDTRDLLGNDDPVFTGFMATHAGASFGGGLFRVLPIDGQLSIRRWNGRTGWRGEWPSIPQATAFASDWLGGLYVCDPGKSSTGHRQIAMLDVATAEYSVISPSFDDFIGRLLPSVGADILNVDGFHAWRASGGEVPSPDHCVGYKIPLTLGGADDPSNMEILFIVVWVSLCGQLWEQTKDLAPGTPISGFTFKG